MLLFLSVVRVDFNKRLLSIKQFLVRVTSQRQGAKRQPADAGGCSTGSGAGRNESELRGAPCAAHMQGRYSGKPDP